MSAYSLAWQLKLCSRAVTKALPGQVGCKAQQQEQGSDQLHLMQGGVVFSNAVTTVSPTYAHESVRRPCQTALQQAATLRIWATDNLAEDPCCVGACRRRRLPGHDSGSSTHTQEVQGASRSCVPGVSSFSRRHCTLGSV